MFRHRNVRVVVQQGYRRAPDTVGACGCGAERPAPPGLGQTVVQSGRNRGQEVPDQRFGPHLRKQSDGLLHPGALGAVVARLDEHSQWGVQRRQQRVRHAELRQRDQQGQPPAGHQVVRGVAVLLLQYGRGHVHVLIVGVDVEGSQSCVRRRQQVQRIPREIGEEVVLAADVGGRHRTRRGARGLGRCRSVEGDPEQRYRPAAGAAENAAVRAVRVADENPRRGGNDGPRLGTGVLPVEIPLVLGPDHGALGVSEDHRLGIGTDIAVQLGQPLGDRCVEGGIEQQPLRNRPQARRIVHHRHR